MVWSRKYSHCQNPDCPNTIDGVTSVVHNAKGFCRSCSSSKHRKENIEQYHEVEAARRAIPENKVKQKVQHDKWRKANEEYYAAYNAQYREEHPDMNREACTKYREANREKCREAVRTYWYNNLEQEREKRRQWRQDNPDIVRMSGRRRRALKAGAEGSHTLEEWLQCVEDHDYKCYHCGCEFTEDNIPTPDHLVPLINEGTHYISNIGPLCGPCNSKKGTKALEEFDPKYYRAKFAVCEDCGGDLPHPSCRCCFDCEQVYAFYLERLEW